MAIVLPKFSRHRSPSGLANEAQPALNVALCADDGQYPAGGLLRATWRISRVSSDLLKSIELSILWHTDGKGDEDLHVHHFHRIDEAELTVLDMRRDHAIDCQLPPTPLSYHGHLMSLRWCLRVRVFMEDGREIVTEQPFFMVAASGSSTNQALLNPAASGLRIDSALKDTLISPDETVATNSKKPTQTTIPESTKPSIAGNNPDSISRQLRQPGFRHSPQKSRS